MRYLKVLVLVGIFFLVMMFFVQNQAAFSDPVTLRFDLLFIAPMESIPMPMYAIMLLCFTAGALLVLLMLMWDRMTIAKRLSGARRKSVNLEKKVESLQGELDKSQADLRAADEKLRLELKDAEQRVNAALRAAGVE